MLAFYNGCKVKKLYKFFVSLGGVKETLDTEVLSVMACLCFSCDV